MIAAVLPSRAGNVPREKAAAAAQAFFAPQARRAYNPSGGLSKGASVLTEAEYGSASLAVFNREGGGFVVVALNDAVPPILAYSPDGRFPAKEEMPEAMAWWLSQMEAQINSLGDKAVQSEEVAERWRNPALSMAKSAGKLYETASWKQGAPFNNHCPMEGGQRCLTGCVAIAGAIICRYFQWPAAGVGTVPAKPSYCSGPDYPEHALGHTYDWADMPLEYGWGYTDAQADKVATLAYDLGTMAEMSYSTKASSANTGVLINGLKTYMKYDKGAYLASRSDFTDSAWNELLTDVLDNYGPTLYSAKDPVAGGHTFVIDGYDADGRIHCNWGWGFANCYCDINSFVPEGQPYNFSASHQVAVGLVPDYEGTSSGRDWLVFVKNGDYAGLSADTGTFEKNVYFRCSTGWFGPKVNAFSGSVYIALYDKDGNFKQDISAAINTSIGLNGMTRTERLCRITCDIAPGDRIRLRYVGQYNEGVITSGAGCVTEIIVMEDNAGGDEPDPAAGYSAAETAASTSLHYDRAGKVLTLTFSHPANWSVKSSRAEVLASGSALEGGSISIDFSGYASGTYTISVGSAEDPFSFTITK